MELWGVFRQGQELSTALFGHLSRPTEVAAELAVAAKEAVKTSRSMQERAEKKFMAAEEKAKDLSAIHDRREDFFAWKGARTSVSLVESIGSLFPLVADGEDAERSYFRWLDAQLPSLTRVIEKTCKFVALFCIDVSLNLLERLGSRHVGSLADASTAIGPDSCEGVSEVVKRVSRRILTNYWVTHGCEAVRADSVTRVNVLSTFDLASTF